MTDRAFSAGVSGFLSVLGVCLGACTSAAAQETSPAFKAPCSGAPAWANTAVRYDEFDFWLGEWHVYVADTGELRGFDIISRDLEGCAIRQVWRSMDDAYAPKGAPWRYSGTSLTGVSPEGVWRQIFIDNVGTNLVLTGGLQDDGTRKLTSEYFNMPRADGSTSRLRYVWLWRPNDDGTIRNWGFVEPEEGEAQQYFELIYRRNAPGSGAKAVLEKR
ncbi:MAG: hypothetical protein AAF668_01805 [Pseudomonadota bacterium]